MGVSKWQSVSRKMNPLFVDKEASLADILFQKNQTDWLLFELNRNIVFIVTIDPVSFSL